VDGVVGHDIVNHGAMLKEQLGCRFIPLVGYESEHNEEMVGHRKRCVIMAYYFRFRLYPSSYLNHFFFWAGNLLSRLVFSNQSTKLHRKHRHPTKQYDTKGSGFNMPASYTSNEFTSRFGDNQDVPLAETQLCYFGVH
jgi:hypothetical protein